MRNKLVCVVFCLCISFSCFAGIGVAKSQKSISIHPGNYNQIIPGFKPDFAILVFKLAKFLRTDTTLKNKLILRENVLITGRSYSCSNFVSDPVLNYLLMAKAIENDNAAFFRCYYKNAAGIIYKY